VKDGKIHFHNKTFSNDQFIKNTHENARSNLFHLDKFENIECKLCHGRKFNVGFYTDGVKTAIRCVNCEYETVIHG